MNICVYGAASKEIDISFIKDGEHLGSEIAKRKHCLVFGGGNNGMMGAVARGVKKENGKIIGVSPSFFNIDGVIFKNCDEYIFTDTMRERKQIMEEKSDAFIVTPGGIGTFEEFFEILTLRQLNRHNKPIAILNTNDYYSHMISFLNNAAENNFMSKENLELYFLSDNIDAILDYIEHPANRNIDIAKLRNI